MGIIDDAFNERRGGYRVRESVNSFEYGSCQTSLKTNSSNNTATVSHQVPLSSYMEDAVHPSFTYFHGTKNPRIRQALGRMDLGSSMTLTRQSIRVTGATVSSFRHLGTISNPVDYSATGVLLSERLRSSRFPVAQIPNTMSMYSDGATAISRTTPTSAHADLLVTLGELYNEGLPKLTPSFIRDRVGFFRSLGSDYLNAEFGWKPFLSSLRDLAYAVKKSDSLTEQLVARSGKPIPVRYNFPAKITTSAVTVVNGQIPYPLTYSQLASSTGQLRTWQSSREDTWFEGVFTYFIGQSSSLSDRLKRQTQLVDYLLGTDITPEALWNLTPWSWAADWLGNIGEVMANASNLRNDGLVLRRAYVMRHLVVTNHSELSDVVLYKQGPIGNLKSEFSSEVKLRRRATPYGFGLDDKVFTPRQWSILIALGLSRGQGSVKYA